MTSSTTTNLAEDVPDPSGRRTGPRWGLWAGVGAAALGVVYLGLVAGTGDGLPRGTTVAGVEVGGMSEAQAVATLQKALAAKAAAPIPATVDGDPLSIAPETAGLSFDAEATVAGLSGRIWNPVTLVAQFTGGPVLDPVVDVDQAKLDETMKGIAGDADAPAQEPAVVIKGTSVTVTPGAQGTVVDQPAAASAVADAYLRTTDPVAIPVVEADPTVSDDAAQQAAQSAKTAISAPVTVTASGISATIPPAAIAAALSYSAKDGALTPALDGAVLRASIARALARVETPGRDATWNVSSGKPVVVPSKVGRGVNPDLLAQDVLAVLDRSGADRAVVAQIGAIPPKLSTEQATALGVTEQMSTFTQHFPYAAYRVQNIGQAAKRINRTLLLPGQVFSLNDTLKERTVANGYTKGFVVGPGGVFKEDLGGGVSTSATATWTAAFYAGLQRVHTQAHSIWIPRYRAGLEATVAWGQFDMSFKNDTPHGVFITTIMTNTSITVQIWGTKVYDDIRAVSGPRYGQTATPATQYDATPTCHAQSGQPGFSIDVYRVFIKDGKEVKREKITTKYRPSPTVKCGVDPAKASPSPSASGTASPTGTPSKTPSTSPSKSP
ncbi:MAG TPA: VanW family protein [Candidatus Nanopelagicales bacterium]|nr:VanW family protein [Candidatus Nanopelagicales bacterium]